MNGLRNILIFLLAWGILAFATYGIGLLLLIPYYFLVLHGADVREKKAESKLSSTLMKDEVILSNCIQGRLFALWSRRELIAITNSRLVLLRRSLLGGFTMKDYQWKDLRDAKLTENILPNFFGSQLSFEVRGGSTGIAIDGLSSSIASKIYSFSQTQEQDWEEKNRIRALEEKRAAAGGVVFNAGSAASSPTSSDNSVFESLENAKKLLDSGAISDAEYQELKSKILSRGFS